MYGHQIAKIIRKDPHMSKRFAGVYTAHRLPHKQTKPPTAYIIHVWDSHWILVYVQKNKVLYFDSAAIELYKYGADLFEWIAELSRKSYIENNTVAVQSPQSKYCGLYCLYVFYFLSRNVPFERILNKFTLKKELNDKIVADFALKKFKFKM